MYGYLWWIIDSEKRISAAIGNSGNVIYVNVLLRIVIAAAHSFKPAIYDWVDFIWEHIEPFVLEQREKIDAQKGKYSRFYTQKSRVKAEKTKIFFQKASSGFGDVSFKERSGRFKA